MERAAYLAASAVWGLVVGSFLNDCIHRLPRGDSVVRPPSSCPHCGARIRPYDNIPVLSFLLLRGRCRDCRGRISWRYPLVELATGALFLALARQSLPAPVIAGQAAWVSLLLVVTLIDLDHQIIPDRLTIPGTVLALAIRALAGESLVQGLLGLLVGGGTLLLTAWLYLKLTGVEGMGMGDVKLMAMVGALLGPAGALEVIFLGAGAGALLGATLMLARRANRRTALPFGTFLAPMAVLVLLTGPWLVHAYHAYGEWVR
jgi:leader peptidase (prepilin peptidase)/N-methyltransferase